MYPHRGSCGFGAYLNAAPVTEALGRVRCVTISVCQLLICSSVHWGLQNAPVPVDVLWLAEKCLQPTKMNNRRASKIQISSLTCVLKRKLLYDAGKNTSQQEPVTAS